jgi:hypothetical protein
MVKYRCLREPGFTRFLWLSALLHVCTAVGLTIFWEQREGDRHSPLSIPLRVSLIHPEEGGDTARERLVEDWDKVQPSDQWRSGDKEAWEAVLNASPFDPFPPQIQQEELHIRARFTYVLEAASQRARVH